VAKQLYTIRSSAKEPAAYPAKGAWPRTPASRLGAATSATCLHLAVDDGLTLCLTMFSCCLDKFYHVFDDVSSRWLTMFIIVFDDVYHFV
jgi:hypothetical protein